MEAVPTSVDFLLSLFAALQAGECAALADPLFRIRALTDVTELVQSWVAAGGAGVSAGAAMGTPSAKGQPAA